MTTETHAGTHPTPGEFAAFIDGKLPESERARVLGHLADCQDCYDVFAETARFLEDHPEAASRTGDVVPFPSTEQGRPPQRALRRLSFAAAALLAVAIGVSAYRSLMSPPEMVTSRLVAPLDGKVTPEQAFHWNRYRSAAPEISDEFVGPSFRAGAWLVDRQAYLDAGNLSEAVDYSRRIGAILKEFSPDDKDSEIFSGDVRRATGLDRIGSKALLEELRNTAEDRERIVDASPLLPEYLDFGKWAEAARLAAITKNPDFFDRRDNRRFPSWFLKREGEAIQEPKVVTALQEIQAVLRQDEIDYATLRKNLETILNAYDD